MNRHLWDIKMQFEIILWSYLFPWVTLQLQFHFSKPEKRWKFTFNSSYATIIFALLFAIRLSNCEHLRRTNEQTDIRLWPNFLPFDKTTRHMVSKKFFLPLLLFFLLSLTTSWFIWFYLSSSLNVCLSSSRSFIPSHSKSFSLSLSSLYLSWP